MLVKAKHADVSQLEAETALLEANTASSNVLPKLPRNVCVP